MTRRWKLTLSVFAGAMISMLLYTAIGGRFDLNAALVFLAIWTIAVLAIRHRDRRQAATTSTTSH